MATTAVIVAIAVAVAAAAVSAYAAYEQGQTQQKIGKFNAKVAENAALARRQAAIADAHNKKEQFAAIMASSRAGAGASGIITGEGSSLLIEMADAENAKLNEARISHRGEVGAQHHEQ